MDLIGRILTLVVPANPCTYVRDLNLMALYPTAWARCVFPNQTFVGVINQFRLKSIANGAREFITGG
jgi:hypothetical protein